MHFVHISVNHNKKNGLKDPFFLL
ncbi:hypothetical protein DSUL_20326 [Desulfovibrionales bacterium]